ncbi:MAG: DUF4331 family protein [Candidatus Sericytochromatia bacterium]
MKESIKTSLQLLLIALTLGACTQLPSDQTPGTAPSAQSTPEPTQAPASTAPPSSQPSAQPTTAATAAPSAEPTAAASQAPNPEPSQASATPAPTASPEASVSPVPTPTPTATSTSSSSGGGGSGGGSRTRTIAYTQIERLARPAVNEGLLISNNLLNLWNMVPPSVDLTDAASGIAGEVTTVLMALGNNQADVNALFTALLPDVMRIDTTRTSGYVSSNGVDLDNVTADLRPIGGRMIEDDVIDVTLQLAVKDGAPFNPAIPGLESDNVSYAGPNANGTAHQPVMADFPYLAAPN